MNAIADDIAADFLIEAREILDQLGEQMVALEHAPTDRNCLNTVFRGFHTIKGGAGFLDFVPMVHICHAVEDRLNVARDGTVPMDAAAFDDTQQSLDLLVDMLAAVSAGEEPEHAPPALLKSLRDGAKGIAMSTAKPASANGDIDEDEFEALLDSLHGSSANSLPGSQGRVGEGSQSRSAASSGADAPSLPPPNLPLQAGGGAKGAAKSNAQPKAAEDPTVRVDVRRLDAMVDLVGELVLARNRLKTIRPRLRDEDLDRAVTALDVATSRLQSSVMMVRMQPVGRVFARFPKLARDVARQVSKSVELDIVGAETELDRNLVEALADPLVHLVRNAIDHGIEAPDTRRASGKNEQGRVRLSAQQEGDHVSIEVSDDGAGIDPEKIRRSAVKKGLIDPDAAARLSSDECLNLIFMAGFSTRSEVSDLSGRGVGMDVVQSKIRELSGQVQIHSEVGRGTRFVIRVPLTLAILPTLLVELEGDVYALPLVRVVEVLAHERVEAIWVDGQSMLDLRDQPLPLIDLRAWLGLAPDPAAATTCVVLQSGEQRFCLTVDRVRGREEVVIKALPRTLRGLAGYAGASLVGDGRMALILDVDALLRTGLRGSSSAARDR
ncbi:chemotaxis protein CheA [Lysobacter sp. MMG2]|uniref:chemotaxis protein CheA n=1 Tax=Lysobacter sp. MMG2 TaxID=2801338 RepID=UPI001C22DB7F|nr:chemotaxis protein CheA [Lysobacter sp. MMG2]MBU8976765.1 chemotaxis protein CheA [Lysobacter sp. MMG2]